MLGCGENRLLKDCPHWNSKGIHQISEAKIVEDMARAMPIIIVALGNWKVYHQSVVVEMSGKIN